MFVRHASVGSTFQRQHRSAMFGHFEDWFMKYETTKKGVLKNARYPKPLLIHHVQYCVLNKLPINSY